MSNFRPAGLSDDESGSDDDYFNQPKRQYYPPPQNAKKKIENALQDAIINNDAFEVEKIINNELNRNVNVKLDSGWTPLMLACFHASEQIVKLLLSKGADPNIGSVKFKLPENIIEEKGQLLTKQETSPTDSQTSGLKAIPLEPKSRRICRDFIWGICNMNEQCKYRHELTRESMQSVLKFCHDFQNKSGCTRNDCTYLHASRSEEELFLSDGIMPPVLAERHEMLAKIKNRSENNALLPPPPSHQNSLALTTAPPSTGRQMTPYMIKPMHPIISSMPAPVAASLMSTKLAPPLPPPSKQLAPAPTDPQVTPHITGPIQPTMTRLPVRNMMPGPLLSAEQLEQPFHSQMPLTKKINEHTILPSILAHPPPPPPPPPPPSEQRSLSALVNASALTGPQTTPHTTGSKHPTMTQMPFRNMMQALLPRPDQLEQSLPYQMPLNDKTYVYPSMPTPSAAPVMSSLLAPPPPSPLGHRSAFTPFAPTISQMTPHMTGSMHTTMAQMPVRNMTPTPLPRPRGLDSPLQLQMSLTLKANTHAINSFMSTSDATRVMSSLLASPPPSTLAIATTLMPTPVSTIALPLLHSSPAMMNPLTPHQPQLQQPQLQQLQLQQPPLQQPQRPIPHRPIPQRPIPLWPSSQFNVPVLFDPSRPPPIPVKRHAPSEPDAGSSKVNKVNDCTNRLCNAYAEKFKTGLTQKDVDKLQQEMMDKLNFYEKFAEEHENNKVRVGSLLSPYTRQRVDKMLNLNSLQLSHFTKQPVFELMGFLLNN